MRKKILWHWGSNTVCPPGGTVKLYWKVFLLCVLLLCKYRPFLIIQDVWAWDLPLRMLERQKHKKIQAVMKIFGWKTHLDMHTSEKEGMGWSNTLPQFEIPLLKTFVWVGASKGFKCFNYEYGGEQTDLKNTRLRMKVVLFKSYRVYSESWVWHNEEEPQSRVKKFSVPALD